MELLDKDTEAVGTYRFWSFEQSLFMSPNLETGFHPSPDSDWVMLQQFLQLWCDLPPKPQPIQGTGVEVLNWVPLPGMTLQVMPDSAAWTTAS